ncbi:MAG: HNH endonuclease [Rhodobacteraceae bacterium]|nr:HNH endonuclease [Paracoccaceae bacterium]
MTRKLCVAAGCDDLALPGGSRCAYHEERHIARQRERRAKAQTSEAALVGRALYADQNWIRASKAFLRRNPLCHDCAELGAVEPATEVDHIQPHRGDVRLFWDRSNWQSLCKPCHSRKTAREVLHTKGG